MAKKNIKQFIRNMKCNLVLFEEYKIYFKDKKCTIKHREDGPAVDGPFQKEWWVNGFLHREDGPAVELSDGTKKWFKNGKCHRIGAPALEFANGAKQWWLNGRPHRKDGPAIEYTNGDKEWLVSGKLHRLDGPAIEYSKLSIKQGCENRFYINDIYYEEDEYWEKISKMRFGNLV